MLQDTDAYSIYNGTKKPNDCDLRRLNPGRFKSADGCSRLEKAISALESEVKALESSSVPWEYSVWGFTFLVAVGVLMELWVIRHDYRDDMETWALSHFGIIRSLGRPSIKKLTMEVGSVLLVTIGIMGELGIGIKITLINGALRSKNVELRTDSDQLVALINSEAEEAKKQAKAADLARVKLEAQIQPRTISALDRQKIADDLKRFVPTFTGRKVKILSSVGDLEEMQFSLEIMDVLKRAGIEVNSDGMGRLWGPFGVVMSGTIMSGPPKDQAFIRSLASGLNDKLGPNFNGSVYGEWKPV